MGFSDDFNRADSSVVGNGWTPENVSDYQILSNRLRANGNSNGSYLAQQILRPSSESFADGTVRVDFTFVGGTSALPSVCGRVQGANNNTFYFAFVSSNILYLSTANNGSLSTMSSGSTGTLAVGVNYQLELVMAGTSFTAKLTNLDTATVLRSLSGVSSVIATAGMQGLSNQWAALIDYDNFFASVPTTAINVVDVGTGIDTVSASNSTLLTVADSGGGVDAFSINVVYAHQVGDGGVALDTPIIAATASVSDNALGGDGLIKDPPMPQLVILERFAIDLSAWTLDTAGGSVNIQTVDNDEKLVLTNTSGIVSAARVFSAPDKSFIIEADMYAASGTSGVLELLDSANNILVSVECNAIPAQGNFFTDLSSGSVFNWSANTYKQIVIKINTEISQVECFYTTANGTTPSKWASVSTFKDFTRGAVISQIRFRALTAGSIRIDEVKVFSPKIFALGDSITAGHATTVASWNPAPEDLGRKSTIEDETHSWPYKLGLKYSPQNWVANRGVDSDKTSDAELRVTSDIIDQGAAKCVIMLGTNDMIADILPSVVETNISAIVNQLVAAGVSVAICTIIPSSVFSAQANINRDTINAWIQAYTLANGYDFVDLYTVTRDTSNPNILLAAYNAGDGIHLSHTGLQAVADTVFNALIGHFFDTGTGIDNTVINTFLSAPDVAAGSDSISIVTPLNISDTGYGIETVNLNTWLGSLVQELSSGIDSSTVIIKSGATLQNIYDKLLTHPTLAEIEASTVLAKEATLKDVHDEALGKWVVDPTAKTLTLYRIDGSVLKVFNLGFTAATVDKFISRIPQ